MVVVIDTGESDGAGGGFVAHHLPRGFLRAARRTRVIASETCAGQQRTDSVEFNKAGVMAAELATGTDSVFLQRFSQSPEPSKLPPRLLTQLGVSSVIRWQELRAGREG